jgi:hypothetical protein
LLGRGVAGVSYLVEFVTSTQKFFLDGVINDDDEITIS